MITRGGASDLIRPEGGLASLDELAVHLMRARQVMKFLEREVEDVVSFVQHVGLDEPLGLF